MESSPSSSGRPPSHPQGARAPLLMRRNPTPRADLSMDDNTVKLLRAAYAGDVPKFKKLAKRLEKAGKSMADVVVGMEAPWDRGYGPLHYAAVAWKVEMCKFLIKDLKFDVDTTEALDTCEGADLLLSNGAYVDPMWEEKTPLYLACQCGNDRMMELLLQHQADPNAVVLLVYTPLKAATYAHSLKAVELLIKAGADVNAGQPVTPLMVAALAGYTECIKCLLKAGADANIPDDKGTLPVEIAAIQGWQECVEILFPVTAPLTRVADWSIDGITQHAKIIRSKAQGYLLQEDGKPDFEADGDAALYERDYAHALTLYTKAVEADPDNSTLYAKMSLCSLHAGDKGKALDYAGTYKGMRPDLSKSCSAQGAALILMKEYGRACEALMSGLRLDFESKPTDIASSGDHL
ncbi:hypothetical protein SETIT_2G162100v2 [Setaria italica]|uniref:Uncharacterized protein n=1 Tax=Setaria italica TaxID=4555 RepID=A0A368PZA9_SETIT|nr:hypothetical protein SETIT_2G162100v2 [Setaria italica]